MESWGPGMDSFDASTMNFWEVVQHTSPLDKHYWYFLVPPSGPTSGTKVCWKMESWGPFDTSIMNFGEVVQLTSPLNKHYWHFQIPPSGPASDSWECWNIEAWGPGLHSFDASTMNFGEVVQHTSPLNKHYWHLLIPPSGTALDSWGCWNKEAWGPGAAAACILLLYRNVTCNSHATCNIKHNIRREKQQTCI